MASAAPALGEVSVDVSANLAKLLSGFKDASTAADRFDKMLSARVGQSSKNAQAATESLAAAEARLMRSFDQAGQAAQRYVRDVDSAKNQTVAAGRQIESTSASIKRALMASAATLAAAFGAHEIMKLSDDYTSFTNRLKSAGLEGDRLAKTQTQLFEIAQHYGVRLETIGSLYGRIGQSQKELGISDAQMIKGVTGAAAAVRVFGASTAESDGALLQLSQMLGDTNVRAQEFNSVNQGARPILVAVANGIDRFHGSVAKLRQEVTNGGLTSKEFFAGWLKGMGQTIQQADKLPLTIGASLTTLNNALGRYIGQTNDAWSATQRIGAGIAALAGNLSTIVPILEAILLAVGTRYVAAFTMATVATIRKAAADSFAALAATALATANARLVAGGGAATASAAVAAASVSRMGVAMGTAGILAGNLGRGLLAAFGGWVGIAIMAVVGAVYLFVRSQQDAAAKVAAMNTHMANAKRTLTEVQPAARAAGKEIKGVGEDAKTAATDMRTFAGATGEAAAQLRALAIERRKEKLQRLQSSKEDLLADRKNAEERFRDAQPGTRQQNYGGQTPDQARAAAAALADIQRIDKLLAAIDARAKAVGKSPLENEVPLAATGGRDIPAEIKQYQTQLVAAEKAHNETAMRTLLAEIKLRQRIVELMEQGLSLEIATATAEAEKLGKEKKVKEVEATTEFLRPVAGGTIRGTVGEKRPGHTHAGVDIAVPAGTEVKAAAGGTVIEAGVMPGYGNVIIIDHGRGTTTRYAHLSQMMVRKGQTVEGGDEIALSGGIPGAPGAGNSRGAHLHYEVRRNGKAVNPFAKGGFPTDVVGAQKDAERIENERIQHEEEYNREAQSIGDAILASRREQQVDAAIAAQMERDRINAERDRNNVETQARLARKHYTADQAKEITARNEALRAEQLRAVDLKEQERKEKEALQLLDQQHTIQIDTLQAVADIARTAAERRLVERRILEAQKAYEKAVLEAKIKSPFTTPIDKLLAQGELANLDKKYGAKTADLNKQSREDLLGMDKGLTGGKFAQNAAKTEAEREQQERLAIVDDALKAGIIKEQEAADRRVEINREAAAKIRDIANQEKYVRLEAAQQIADGLQQIATTIFGEHSKAARAMFIVSKGFAIAEAALKLQVAIANAASIPFPANIPAIATAVALGASIISNIASITAQFDTGGWTGSGDRRKEAGVVHYEEFVVKAGPASRHRALLETINAGRDPTAAIRSGGAERGLAAASGGYGDMSVAVHNHAPGVEHEVNQIGPGEVEIIARRVVHKEAPGVVASDMQRPNSKTSKALRLHTTARPNRK